MPPDARGYDSWPGLNIVRWARYHSVGVDERVVLTHEVTEVLKTL
jgi:hypothetical protein